MYKIYDKEVITTNNMVGVNIDQDTGVSQETEKFIIHFGKNGTHIVPTGKKGEL